MITAALQPTALTIRHSRFATLTLAKLVASLALHPPASATEADYAPQGEAFGWVHFPTIALNHARFPPPTMPPWHADEIGGAGLAKPDQGGKQEANGGKLAFIRAVQAFSCHGGLFTSLAFQLHPIDFHVTHRFFVTFFTEESNVSPPSSQIGRAHV